MSLDWDQVVVDAAQPAALGLCWANALGWVVTFEAEQPWVVLADPEGNEFCVLAPRRGQPPDTHLAESAL